MQATRQSSGGGGAAPVTCPGYRHLEDVWPFQDSGDDGGWRMSDAASRRLRFRVGRLVRKILPNRCQLNSECQMAAQPSIGRERAHKAIGCIAQ